MAEDTADGKARSDGWPPVRALELKAEGAIPAGEVARGARGVAFVALFTGAGAGSAATAGSTPHRSKAKARIDGQAVRSVMTSPGPSEKTGVHRVAGGGP